ncbi:thioesterase II family protein [Streptomyces sp. NPDC101165]|uniref:thioesterase II family protein n=1 Tax=Streptomyces sp. NPDC101165 TaxID=3366119 RepID=UPI0037F3234D
MTRVAEPWLRPAPAGGAAARLFCLPYAGGSASVFRHWTRRPVRGRGGRRLEVVAVRLPGHGSRTAEPAVDDARLLAGRLAAALDPYLDRPYGIYGHSMGGLLGLALAHEIARTPGRRPPAALFVGASPPPASVRPDAAWHGSDAELVQWLREAGGTPASVLAAPVLLELLLPALRADLALVAGYRSEPGERLAVAVHGFAGADDALVPAAAMRPWAAETDAPFALCEVPGGHFFLADGAGTSAVLGAVAAQLLT